MDVIWRRRVIIVPVIGIRKLHTGLIVIDRLNRDPQGQFVSWCPTKAE
jgi:hypothetical protein